jgi:hypothetical protein
MLASAGGAMDASTLQDWSDGRFSLVEAQYLLDTLVLEQCASVASDESTGGSVELEPFLEQVLKAHPS